MNYFNNIFIEFLMKILMKSLNESYKKNDKLIILLNHNIDFLKYSS